MNHHQRPHDGRETANLKILGIDPGLQRTGYAILSIGSENRTPQLHEAGVIRLPRPASLATRLLELDRSLSELIEHTQPDTLTCEELYAHYRHPRTAILMGHARGVILTAAARAGLEIIPVAATNVKKLLTGSGRAGKRQVQLAVAHTLQLDTVPEPHDVADAMAIALTGFHLHHSGDVTGIRTRGVQA